MVQWKPVPESRIIKAPQYGRPCRIAGRGSEAESRAAVTPASRFGATPEPEQRPERTTSKAAAPWRPGAPRVSARVPGPVPAH